MTQKENNKKRRISADILDMKSGILIHPVSTNGRLAGGYSSQIKKKFPAQAEHYQSTCKQYAGCPKSKVLGSILFSEIEDNLFIAHFFCMESAHDKNYVNSLALSKCIDEISSHIDNPSTPCYNFPVYVPYKMGAGIHGGDWSEIETEFYSKVRTSQVCVIPKK